MKRFLWLLGTLFIGIVFFLWLFSFSKEKQFIPVIKEESADLFGNYYSKAEQVMESMSIKEKVGQLFLVRFDEGDAYEMLEKYYPGGFLFFAKDFKEETVDSFSAKTFSYQQKSKVPLLMAVDEEGGIVTRVSKFPAFRSEKFLSSQELYSQGGYELVAKVEAEKAKLLLKIGLNLNLAPVADVSINPTDYIYSRSFGKNAEETSEYVKRMVEYANEQGISSSLKHFPGYGNNVDTHTGVAIDERSYETFLTQDFLPFRAGIEASVPTILFSHNIVTSMDSELPASLSKKVHNILREELGFSGIIITDDLSMGALQTYSDTKKLAQLAVLAGNDLLITSDLKVDYQEVLDGVHEGIINMNTIDLAVRRILAWKYAYGLY